MYPSSTPQSSGTANSSHFASSCDAYRDAVRRARLYAADAGVTILIEGESGTGKTLLARHLHDCSPRRHGPFERLVLSTVDDALAGSELFGHVAGAFTDARTSRRGRFLTARGGSLFLDEVGKASLALQGKLLDAVEYRQIRPIGADEDIRADVRVIAATNCPLPRLVDEGTFLPDLAARLVPFTVRIPPLRERRADLPSLVMMSVRRHAHGAGLESVPEIHPDLMTALCRAPWPLNHRQLDTTIQRLLLEAERAPLVTLGHCEEDLAYLRALAREETPLTRELVEAAVRTAKSKSAAAMLLGVHRTTVHRYLAES